jgi:hypothetical protein
MVSCFDPMPVEIAAGFALPGFVELARLFGLAVRQSIGLGTAFVVLPFRLLPDRPKIDNIGHAAPRW